MILIIGAMEEEVQELLNLSSNINKCELNTILYYEAELSGKKVVIARSGVGKVNATFTASILGKELDPELIINIGSAGGLKENQTVGDVVLASKLSQHDVYIGATTFTDARFKATTSNKFDEIISQVLTKLNMPYHSGEIVSGDQFVTLNSKSHQNIIENLPEAIAAEMEATAIASVANKLEIPVIILRALSDIIVIEGNDQTFEEFLVVASKNSAKITQEIIKQI